MTIDTIRKFDRDTWRLASGILIVLVLAALVLAGTIYGSHQKLDKLTGQAASALWSREPSSPPPAPDLSLTLPSPEEYQGDKQANGTWVAAPDQEKAVSGRGLKNRIARSKASKLPRLVDIKRRLIELWHQSLAREEKSGDWTAFSNLQSGVKKKAALTGQTSH